MLDRERSLTSGRYSAQDKAAYARSALYVYGVVSKKMDEMWPPREIPGIVERCLHRLKIIGDSFVPKSKPRSKKKGDERKPVGYFENEGLVDD